MMNFKMKLIPFSVTTVLALISCLANGQPCARQSLCYCLLTNGSYIDLSPLANITFNLLNTEGQYRYSFEICKPFTLDKDCTNVYGCQYNNNTGKFNALGITEPTFLDANTIKMENETNVVYIHLQCSNEGNIFQFASKFYEASPYNFTLESKHACVQNSTEPTSSSNVTTPETTSHITYSTATTGSTTAGSTRVTTSAIPTATSVISTFSMATHRTGATGITTTVRTRTTTNTGCAFVSNLWAVLVTCIVVLKLWR